jgi:hypothetical protein
MYENLSSCRLWSEFGAFGVFEFPPKMLLSQKKRIFELLCESSHRGTSVNTRKSCRAGYIYHLFILLVLFFFTSTQLPFSKIDVVDFHGNTAFLASQNGLTLSTCFCRFALSKNP